MELNLAGKVAIVTGGARGIGEGIATQLAAEGVKVAIADIDAVRAEKTLSALGPDARFVKTDVTDENSVRAAVESVQSMLGPVDILVNNAGISSRMRLAEMAYEDFDRVFKVNMYGTYLMTRAVIEEMRKRKQGKIVNIAALVGTRPDATFAHYSASKAAVIAFTNAIAAEYAEDNLNINCISPGAVATRLWSKENLQTKDGKDTICFNTDIECSFSLGRAQKIEDIANMVCYLVSDLTRNISGQNFFVTS